MPATKKIPHDQLVQYFDSFTKRFLRDNVPERVDVEVISPDWGHQEADKGVRLEGITYDTHTDSLEFALDVGDHRVLKPQEVWTIEEPDGFISSIEVIRADGEKELITIKHDGLQRLPEGQTQSNR